MKTLNRFIFILVLIFQFNLTSVDFVTYHVSRCSLNDYKHISSKNKLKSQLVMMVFIDYSLFEHYIFNSYNHDAKNLKYCYDHF